MKKTFVIGAAICTVFAMTSCKSKESAYKKAYEKAKAQQTVTSTPVQQPVQTTPVNPQVTTPVTPVQTQDYSNVSVRSENFTLLSGSALKAYSVVVGSFGVKANAEGLSRTLAAKGYSPRVLQASTTKGTMYRVVAMSYDTKSEAAQSRSAFLSQYPGTWLLYKK